MQILQSRRLVSKDLEFVTKKHFVLLVFNEFLMVSANLNRSGNLFKRMNRCHGKVYRCFVCSSKLLSAYLCGSSSVPHSGFDYC